MSPQHAGEHSDRRLGADLQNAEVSEISPREWRSISCGSKGRTDGTKLRLSASLTWGTELHLGSCWRVDVWVCGCVQVCMCGCSCGCCGAFVGCLFFWISACVKRRSAVHRRPCGITRHGCAVRVCVEGGWGCCCVGWVCVCACVGRVWVYVNK